MNRAVRAKFGFHHFGGARHANYVHTARGVARINCKSRDEREPECSDVCPNTSGKMSHHRVFMSPDISLVKTEVGAAGYSIPHFPVVTSALSAPAFGNLQKARARLALIEIITVRDTDSKGGARGLLSEGPLTKSFVRHGCNGCGTDWAVVGVGRAKESVSTHKCASCGAEILACCNTKKSADVATKGMDKKFEVAPLK